MTWNKRVWLGLLLLLSLWAPLGVQAQSPVSLSAAQVDLWPEFDRPSLLVIYHFTLAPSVSLPAQVTLRIPEAAGDPHAVAVRSATGELLTTQFQREVVGEWSQITLTADSADIQLEYYIDLAREGDRRQFSYTWPGDFAVDNLVIDIQQPVDTVSMDVNPPAQVVQRADGPYSRVNPGRLEAGQNFTVAVDYEKTSDTLTTETMAAAENNTVPAVNVEAANGSTFEALLPVGLAALGVALLIVGGWWFWSIRQERQPAASRRGRRRSSAGEASTGEMVYCHQCGARSRPGDVFCRTCGAKLRT